jgi:Domain of unknown function (DUF4157)/Pretoxin HINT domain
MQIGRPLDSTIRGPMEGLFGQSLADVRVHTGPAAEASTRAMGASAYAVGRDVVFGDNYPSPNTFDGRLLIAHELAHVLQQRGSGASSGSSSSAGSAELDAHQAALQVALGRPAKVTSRTPLRPACAEKSYREKALDLMNEALTKADEIKSQALARINEMEERARELAREAEEKARAAVQATEEQARAAAHEAEEKARAAAHQVEESLRSAAKEAQARVKRATQKAKDQLSGAAHAVAKSGTEGMQSAKNAVVGKAKAYKAAIADRAQRPSTKAQAKATVRDDVKGIVGTVEGVVLEVGNVADTLLWAESKLEDVSGLMHGADGKSEADDPTGLSVSGLASASLGMSALGPAGVPLALSSRLLRYVASKSPIDPATGQRTMIDPLTGAPMVSGLVTEAFDWVDTQIDKSGAFDGAAENDTVLTAREMGQITGSVGSQVGLAAVGVEEVALVLKVVGAAGAARSVEQAARRNAKPGDPTAFVRSPEFWIAIGNLVLFVAGLRAASAGRKLLTLFIDAAMLGLAAAPPVIKYAYDYVNATGPKRDEVLREDLKGVIHAGAQVLQQIIAHHAAGAKRPGVQENEPPSAVRTGEPEVRTGLPGEPVERPQPASTGPQEPVTAQLAEPNPSHPPPTEPPHTAQPAPSIHTAPTEPPPPKPQATPAPAPGGEHGPSPKRGRTFEKPPADPYDKPAWDAYYKRNPNAPRSLSAAAADDPHAFGSSASTTETPTPSGDAEGKPAKSAGSALEVPGESKATGERPVDAPKAAGAEGQPPTGGEIESPAGGAKSSAAGETPSPMPKAQGEPTAGAEAEGHPAPTQHAAETPEAKREAAKQNLTAAQTRLARFQSLKESLASARKNLQSARDRQAISRGRNVEPNAALRDAQAQISELANKLQNEFGVDPKDISERALAPKELELANEIKQAKATLTPLDIQSDPQKHRATLPCFVAGTPVATPTGPRAIESLAAGDTVLAFDFQSETFAPALVVGLHQASADRLVRVTLDGEEIQATRRHPFWVESLQGWVEARALETGMHVKTLHGPAVIERVETGRFADTATFNLHIERLSTFCVGPGAVVHNEGVDAGQGGSYIIYRITNTLFPEKCYIGQTTTSGRSGKTRGATARFQEHVREAETEIAEINAELAKNPPPEIKAELKERLDFFNFKKGANPPEVLVYGIANKAQADWLEQQNIVVERKARGEVNVLNRRNQISAKRLQQAKEEIMKDPKVKCN